MFLKARVEWGYRWWAWAVIALLWVPSASAVDRELKAMIHNFKQTPLEVKRSNVVLVQTYATPSLTAGAEPETRKKRVRYANKTGQLPVAYQLSGEMVCANKTQQAIEALGLTIIPLDAFHQPIEKAGQGQAYSVEQLIAEVPPGTTRRLAWEHTVQSGDIYEVAVLVTRVRYADGTVWFAPAEEMVKLF